MGLLGIVTLTLIIAEAARTGGCGWVAGCRCVVVPDVVCVQAGDCSWHCSSCRGCSCYIGQLLTLVLFLMVLVLVLVFMLRCVGIVVCCCCLIVVFVRDVVVLRRCCSSLHRSLARLLTRLRLAGCSLARSLARLFCCSLAKLFGRSLLQSVGRSLGRSLARLLARSPARSLARSPDRCQTTAGPGARAAPQLTTADPAPARERGGRSSTGFSPGSALEC